MVIINVYCMQFGYRVGIRRDRIIWVFGGQLRVWMVVVGILCSFFFYYRIGWGLWEFIFVFFVRVFWIAVYLSGYMCLRFFQNVFLLSVGLGMSGYFRRLFFRACILLSIYDISVFGYRRYSDFSKEFNFQGFFFQ